MQFSPHPTIDEIAAQVPGYAADNLHADDVGRFLSRLVSAVGETEEVGIFDALGRVLAQDLVSPINVPAHDNSAMDGYAFDGSALASGALVRLRVVGTALAGQAWAGQAGPGEAVRIMTGAMMPAGLDTVVPQEQVRLDGDTLVLAAGLLARGANRRRCGEDLQQGQPALRQGEWLGPAALGLLASLGIARACVVRRLKVAYFSTGNEILSLGDPLREGAVYDSNRYTVFGLLSRLGVQVIDMGVLRDEPAALEAAFLSAAGQADAIITSGGVSGGDADYTKAMMHQLAADSGGVAFWRIAMRPGRPMAVGRIAAGAHTAVLFGLPGNPVAVMVAFLAFVRPALLQMMGCRARSTPLLRARSLEAIRKKPGRTEYQRGSISRADDGSLQVRSTGNQGSGVLSSMVLADALIVLRHEQGDIAAGDQVDVVLLDGLT